MAGSLRLSRGVKVLWDLGYAKTRSLTKRLAVRRSFGLLGAAACGLTRKECCGCATRIRRIRIGLGSIVGIVTTAGRLTSARWSRGSFTSFRTAGPCRRRRTLGSVLRFVPAGARVACWVRGERPTVSFHPLAAWEPVIYYGGRARKVLPDRRRLMRSYCILGREGRMSRGALVRSRRGSVTGCSICWGCCRVTTWSTCFRGRAGCLGRGLFLEGGELWIVCCCLTREGLGIGQARRRRNVIRVVRRSLTTSSIV